MEATHQNDGWNQMGDEDIEMKCQPTGTIRTLYQIWLLSVLVEMADATDDSKARASSQTLSRPLNIPY